MNSVPELIQAVESAGGRFMVDGGRLGIVPATAAVPLMVELREHKGEIIELLAQRPAMPAGVRLVSWNPKAAPVRVSQCETVTDTDLFIRSTLMQLEAALEGRSWASGNWGLSGLLERLAAVGCAVAPENPRRALQ
jgi:hypothetical protein